MNRISQCKIIKLRSLHSTKKKKNWYKIYIFWDNVLKIGGAAAGKGHMTLLAPPLRICLTLGCQSLNLSELVQRGGATAFWIHWLMRLKKTEGLRFRSPRPPCCFAASECPASKIYIIVLKIYNRRLAKSFLYIYIYIYCMFCSSGAKVCSF